MDFESWKEMMAEQQAQFWADLRAIEAQQAEPARRLEEDRKNIAKLADRVDKLVKRNRRD
jgi:hypothetical protein